MAQATNQGAVRVRVLVANQAGNGHTIDCFLFSSVIAEVLQCDYFGRISMPLVATSLKLPKTLKSRITRLAKRAGESPHAFMLRLLENQVEAAERFEQFVADARQADQRMQESGQGYAAAEVHSYLKAKIARRKATRPKPAQWRK